MIDMSGVNEVQDRTAAPSSTSPSSWLEVKWVSRHDDSTTQLPSNHTSYSFAALSQELNALKHQFVPASAECAESINNFHHQNGSKEKTNASFEFRRARSMCNLYESLGPRTGQSQHYKFSKKRRRKVNHCSGPSFSNSRPTSGFSQFVNRSAIKLANIDALLNFSLTNPHSIAHVETQEEPEKYFAFVDLCGAPGGFSEYIMYRRVRPAKISDRIPTNNQSSDDNDRNDGNKGHDHCNSSLRYSCNVSKSNIPCFGFGMSLIGTNEDGIGVEWDWSHLKSSHLSSSKHSRARPTKADSDMNRSNVFYHVCHGSDGTGDIYNWDNVLRLRHQMIATLSRISHREKSHGSKPNDQISTDDVTGLVHLVVADGGFDAQRDSASQEQLALHIIVCQTAAALTLLKSGGNFVLKMFGFQLKRTQRVLQHLYGKFDRMAFVKPILSRPASAERYLICYGYDGQSEGWDGLLWRNEMMKEIECSYDEGKSTAQQSGKYSNLNTLMDAFDIQMLQLNINACRSIVDHLNNRTIAAQQGDASVFYQPKEDVDVEMYELIWQIL